MNNLLRHCPYYVPDYGLKRSVGYLAEAFRASWLVDLVWCEKHVGYWFFDEVHVSATSTYHFPFTHIRLSSIQVIQGDTSKSTEWSDLKTCSSFSGDRFSGLSVGRLVFPSYFQHIQTLIYLNSSLYEGRPIYPWKNVYQELRIVVHLHSRQLDFLEFQGESIRRCFARLCSAVQKVVCQELHPLASLAICLSSWRISKLFPKFFPILPRE